MILFTALKPLNLECIVYSLIELRWFSTYFINSFTKKEQKMKKIMSMLAVVVFVACSVVTFVSNTCAMPGRCSATPLYEVDYYEGCEITGANGSYQFYPADQLTELGCNTYCSPSEKIDITTLYDVKDL